MEEDSNSNGIEPEEEKKVKEKCSFCQNEKSPEDDYCMFCSYPPSGSVEDKKASLENVGKIEDINDYTKIKQKQDETEHDANGIKTEKEDHEVDHGNEDSTIKDNDSINQEENETTPFTKAKKRELAEKPSKDEKDENPEQKAKFRKKIDYDDKCTSKTCADEKEKLEKQSEEQLDQIFRLEKAINEKGLIRKLNTLEDEIEDNLKDKKLKQNTIERQNAQIKELLGELVNERDAKAKAQKERANQFKEQALQKKKYEGIVTKDDDDYAFFQQLVSKCRTEKPKEFFVMEPRNETEKKKIIGIIARKKENENCHVQKLNYILKGHFFIRQKRRLNCRKK